MLVILLEHKPHLSLDELRQTLLHIARNFTSILAMAICHSEKVAVFETAEMRYCDPRVLILLVGIRGGLACLCSESELSHAVCVHLSWISRIKRVFLLIGSLSRWLTRLRQDWLWLALPTILLRERFLPLRCLNRHLHHLLRVLRLWTLSQVIGCC